MSELNELIVYWHIIRELDAAKLNPYHQDHIEKTIRALEELKKLKGEE